MPRAKTATERGLEPHYKVRVVLPGAVLHLASRTEPDVERIPLEPGPGHVRADWIEHHDYGDTLGFIQWEKVVAISWRFAP